MAQAEFDSEYFARLEAAQDHWWVKGMREVSAALLGATPSELAALDAGSGAGSNLHWLAGLAEPGHLVAVDLSAAAIQQCRRLPLPVAAVQASVPSLPFADRRFDLVVSTDVLQHLTEPDEERAVSEMRRVLRPGGRVLVRTNCIFGRRAVAQRADWRLYSIARLDQALAGGGLVVDRITPANSLQGLWASLPRPSRRAVDDHRPGVATEAAGHGLGLPRPAPPIRNAGLLRLMCWEARWLARPGRRLPFGHSLVAVAHRPADRAESNGRAEAVSAG